ncbi:MAG: insulinase family protein [Cyclobacteriaceae bacterium]|nr:insulinase family protein [Cyclobacteriaceae bacterium]
MQDHSIFTLQNGIRIVHKQIQNSKIAHCGFILDIGSRDESPNQLGLAHFWEHMAFKGTKKRRSFQIINKLDTLGGELNAYTSKENICFYASVLNDHTEKAFDLLTDITFNSTFPENQIEKERNVILEEMSIFQDTPEDAIQDEFDQLIFSGHPLGSNILGTKESVLSFRQSDFFYFIRQRLNTDHLIFSSVSSLPFSKVLRLANKYLKDIPIYNAKKSRKYFENYIAKTRLEKKHIMQAHCGIGTTTYSNQDSKRLPFSLLINTLGGPALNSRLNLTLREKYGLVYSIDANYSAFHDIGLMSIFFGTEKKQLYKSVNLVIKELRKLTGKPMGSGQLHKAKEQFIGQMAMAEENNISLMLMHGKSLLIHNKIESFEDVVKKIRKVTSNELFDIANQIFDENKLSFLYFIPQE